MNRSLADIRENYALAALSIADTSASPFTQFSGWLDEALKSKLPEPTAMTLATVDSFGAPATRTVLLKGATEMSLSFYTNYESRKGRHMAENPRVSLLILWKELQRQVSIDGAVEKTPPEDSDAYYQSRPYGHQIGAWASQQSEEIPNREWMEQREAQFRERYAEGGVPRPEHWGGYHVVPRRFEFWQGRPSRLHDRIEYRLDDDGMWTRRRLSP